MNGVSCQLRKDWKTPTRTRGREQGPSPPPLPSCTTWVPGLPHVALPLPRTLSLPAACPPLHLPTSPRLLKVLWNRCLGKATSESAPCRATSEAGLHTHTAHPHSVTSAQRPWMLCPVGPATQPPGHLPALLACRPPEAVSLPRKARGAGPTCIKVF